MPLPPDSYRRGWMPAGYAAAAIGMRGDAEVQKRVGKVLGNCIERILRNEGEMKGDPAERAFYRAFRDSTL